MTTPAIRSAALSLVDQMEAAAVVEGASRPHVVVQTDPLTGARQSFGPYEDELDALRAVDRLRGQWLTDHGRPVAQYLLVPHFGRDDQ